MRMSLEEREHLEGGCGETSCPWYYPTPYPFRVLHFHVRATVRVFRHRQ